MALGSLSPLPPVSQSVNGYLASSETLKVKHGGRGDGHHHSDAGPGDAVSSPCLKSLWVIPEYVKLLMMFLMTALSNGHGS